MPVLQQPQLERERDEPLLGAVVEVALEPPALGVARRDDPLARGLQLGEPRRRLGVQARVLERDRRRGGDRLDELGVVVERGVVDERGDLAPVALDGRDGAVAAGLRQRAPAARRRRRRRRTRAASRRRASSGSPSVLRERAPAGRRRASEPRSRTSSARPPRASRERSRPARNAAGTATSEQAAQPQQHLRARAGDQVVDEQRGEAGERERAGEAREQRAPARAGGARASAPRSPRRSPCRAGRASRAGAGRSDARSPRPGRPAAGSSR